jgi:hypothetical protein
MNVEQQSIDMTLTGLGVMAQDDKASLINLLSMSGSLADETMSSQELLDLSLKAIQDSPKFRQLISDYFTHAVEESMRQEIGLSFAGGEDFFNADGYYENDDDDEEIVDIYGDAMRNADGYDEEDYDDEASMDGEYDDYDDEANMDGEDEEDDEDYDDMATEFAGGEEFFNLVDGDMQEEVIDDELEQPSFAGGEDFFSADGDDDEEMIDIYN